MAATAQGDRAQLWLRVDRWHGQRGAFDNMENRPIVSSEWRDYDIVADVADDAVSISIGLFVRGGTAWLDAVRFEIAPDSRPTSLSNAFPQDLDMEQGEIGQPPPGWQLDGEPGALAAITQDRPRHGKRCVLLSFQGESSPSYHGLYQTVDAAPYRGKRVRLRVAVRTDFAGLGAGTAPWPRNRAQLVLEVILSDLKTGFSDSMENRPIVSTEWRDYEIVGDVASDASFINIGLFLAGQGRAWFDDVRFDIIGDDQPQHP